MAALLLHMITSGTYELIWYTCSILASSASYNKVAAIVGIEFGIEDRVSELGARVGHGRRTSTERHVAVKLSIRYYYLCPLSLR